MSMVETCRYLNLTPTEEQLAAGRYLESRGLMFCGHFGTDNAIEMADAMFEEECARIKETNDATT